MAPNDPQQPPAPPPPHRASSLLWVLALAMLGLWLWRSGSGFGALPAIPYSEFEQKLAAGEVAELRIGSREIEGFLLPPAAHPGENAAQKPFRSVRIDDPELPKKLAAAKVQYTGVADDALGPLLLGWMLPLLLLVGLGWLGLAAARRAGTQLSAVGKSRARLVPETGIGVTFDDVAGCDEAKQELHEMVEFLRSPQRFTALGAHIPKGVLLLGPPGTGKTLLARAVAGESGVPFYCITGSDFVEMFVGVGAARVRSLFADAKQQAPCIVFIDEIDAVGRQRGVSMGVVNDEREQTLNQLLAEMDGFEANSGVIVLAATNRPEVLDRALLRPGRFDRQVVLDAPDIKGREAILRVHSKRKPLAKDVDLQQIAQQTPGMSGADLANALNEAALLAANGGHAQITRLDLEAALEKVIAGPMQRSRRLSLDERQRVACHEAGHALVAAHCPHADPVQKISIVPRGRRALGFTMTVPLTEQYLRTRSELMDRLQVLLGGRAAEELALDEVSTGAQDDLAAATALAQQMVCTFGMSELGIAHCARLGDSPWLGEVGALHRDCSEATAREIDEEVRLLLEQAYERAMALLSAHRDELERVVVQLLQVETLDRAGFESARRGAVELPAPAHAGG